MDKQNYEILSGDMRVRTQDVVDLVMGRYRLIER